MNIPSKLENPNGLHSKYIISKANGDPLEKDSEYFVLRLDTNGDPMHIEACRKAILVYAESIKSYIPKLSSDLIDRYSVK